MYFAYCRDKFTVKALLFDWEQNLWLFFSSSTSNAGLGNLQDPISPKRVRQEVLLNNRVLRVPKMSGKHQNAVLAIKFS